MKQVSHAEALVAALAGRDSDEDEELEKMLVSQLSHSDGIRGFFVTYLTGDESPADKPSVPLPLQKAMAQVDVASLVPLACMNVVMPTGTISVHKDPSMAEQSRKTSQRGSRVLASLLQLETATVRENCDAILAVASGSDDASDANAELIKVSRTICL